MDAEFPTCQSFPVIDAEPSVANPCRSARGVGWVLRWAAALAVLIASLVILIDFAYTLAAEQTLARAARAAALEATLPHATLQSIVDTAERRMQDLDEDRGTWKIYVEQNGTPVRGVLRPQEGDRLTVTLAVPSQAVLPGWLHIASAWQSDRPIEARAERRMPTHRLPNRGR